VQQAGETVRYGVMPDLSSGGCQNGCLYFGSALDSTTAFAGAMLVDAITDPDDGFLATNPPTGTLGWANLTIEELSNACDMEPTYSRAGFRVQQLWSDRANACISP
jgi:hypothetical protein